MNLSERDARVVWHPYTQHAIEPPRLSVAEAQGARLTLNDGRELIDAISSWWAVLHGHGQPELVAASTEQASTLDHVLFAGATHEPAVALAEQLLQVVPKGLARVFYSDDGSTAVEVALKMVLQHHLHRGQQERRVFVALEGSYHGDTFGAMAVGDPDPFFKPFSSLLFDVRRVPVDAAALEQALDELGPRAAGVILEPLVQGAAGMQMHGTEFLQAVRRSTRERDLPLIADEVMTGFGRTGALFACGKAEIEPDVLCLAKGLTGGMVPLAATLATEAIYESFLSDDRSKALFHGHTFSGHPIGCAVGLASLALVRDTDVPGRLDRLGKRIAASLQEHLGSAPGIHSLRQLGGIVAFDLAVPDGQPAGYLASRTFELRAAAIREGVLLRPLGNVLYAMPPACTSDEQADRIANALVAVATLPS